MVILSVTEGEDKPLKYPDMFRAADLMLVSKVDLAPYVSFDIAKAVDFARRVRPGLEVIEVSATTGAGFDRVARVARTGSRGRGIGPRRRCRGAAGPWRGKRREREGLTMAPTPALAVPLRERAGSRCAASCRAWASGRSCTAWRATSRSTARCATTPRA